MAEKVRDGIDGFHFSVGSSMALASLLRELAVDRTMLSDLALQMSGRSTVESSIEAFLDLYRGETDAEKGAEFQNVSLFQ